MRSRRTLVLGAVLALLLVGLASLLPFRAPAPHRPAAPVAVAARAMAPDASLEDWRQRIRAAARGDYRTLARAAFALADPHLRQAVLAELLRTWLHVDAADFNKFFMALEVDHDVPALNLLAEALKVALTQLDDAVAASDAVKDLVRRLVLHLARHDPTEALAWANAWLLGDTREAALVQIARALARGSAAQGLQVAAQISAPLRRMQALAAVGGAWAQADAASALRWAADLAAPTERAFALNSVLLSIAQSDPRNAADQFSQEERRLAEEYRQKYRRDLAALNLTEADLANDRETYLDLLNSGALPPPTSPDAELLADAARVIAERLARNQAGAGAAWAATLEHELLRLHGAAGAVSGWSRSDPVGAVAYLSDNYDGYRELVASLYETWAADDVAEAAAGTRLLSNDALRLAAVETVSQSWALSQPAAAAAWLDRLPAADRSDVSQLAVVYGLSQSEPAAAWQRAQAIQDPALQYRGLKAAFTALVTTNAAQARELLANATLAPKHTERLHELLRASEGG